MTLDEQTGAKLLEDILASPHDDATRLIYADWLEEFGGDAFRAAAIRHGLAGGVQVVRGQLVRLGRKTARVRWTANGGPGSLRGFTAWVRRTLPPPDAEHPQVGVFRGGFLDGIHCPLAWWLGHGRALAARHPVARVELSDRRPFPSGGMWLWRGADPVPPNATRCGLPSWAIARMPDPSNLKGLHRWFDTQEQAEDAASDALLSWAKGRPA